MKLLVEQHCPGMEATDDCVRQEIPDVPLTRVLVEFTTGKIACPFLYSQYNFCNRPLSGDIPEKEGRSSGRVGCRYFFPEGTVWKDVNGQEVNNIFVVLPSTNL